MNPNAYRISVIGLGKLGLPLLAHFASKGCYVIGVEKDAEKREALNAGQTLWHESGVPEILRDCRKMYRATDDFIAAVSETNITFIVVPTPSEPNGSFSNSFVIDCAREVGRALKTKQGRHLVVLTSTVMPETTQHVFVPILQKESGRIVGEDLGVCYNPEFIALGTVLQDLASPDFVLIGEVNPADGEELASLYRTIGCKAPCARMSPVSAEIAKLALNAYITLKISVANSLASLCERVPGASASDVTRALGMDQRIGRKCLRPGLGYGGPCFPRDNVALGQLFESLGIGEMTFAAKTDSVNQSHLANVVSRIMHESSPNQRIAVVGLAYKSRTPVTTKSHGLSIAQILSDCSRQVIVYDPLADSAGSVFSKDVVRAASLQEAVSNSDLIVLALPVGDAEGFIAMLRRGQTIFDCWPGDPAFCALPEGVRYVAIGESA